MLGLIIRMMHLKLQMQSMMLSVMNLGLWKIRKTFGWQILLPERFRELCLIH